MLEAKVCEILTCDMCEETLGSNVELQRHIKAYHKQNVRESKTIKCKVCGKPFKTKGDLERHTIQKHLSIKIKEDLLMKEIKLATDIFQQKERIHKDIFKLRQKYLLSRGQCFCKGKCYINHFKYRWTNGISASNLEHLYTKISERKFNCNVCDFSSSDLNDLQKHKVNVHKGKSMKTILKGKKVA